MIKKVLNFLLTANVSAEDYKIAKDDMYKNDLMMLRVLSSISTAIFLVCTLIGFFIENMNSKMEVYLTGLVFSIFILLASLFSKNIKLHSVCMFILYIILLGAGLSITLLSAPEQLTITLIPVALLIPLFFDTKPYKFLIVVLLSDLVYVIFAPIVKPADILALDMVDVLAFSIAGLLIGTVITKVKIERYVYAYEIRKIAMYDSLTDCFNRAAYNKYIEEHENNIPENLTAVMVDINGLKGINDNKGHKAGDEMIVTVARTLKSVFSGYGDCYRLGGDEFMVFAEIENQKIESLIELLRKTLAENDGELVKEITVSAGYAKADDCEAKTLKAMVNKADQRMYDDKDLYYAEHGNRRRI